MPQTHSCSPQCKTHKTVRKWSGGAGLTKTAIQQILKMEGLQSSVWSGLPGNLYAMRGGRYHRIIWIAEGSMTVTLIEENRVLTLAKGDRLDLPAGVAYQAIVGPEGLICVEACCKKAATTAAASILPNGATNKRRRLQLKQ